MVEVATEVGRPPTLPSVSEIPSLTSRLAILAPRSSSPTRVANVTECPRRARPTATLAGLPPTCSWVERSACRTTSISDSPTTRMWPVMSSCEKVGDGQAGVLGFGDGQRWLYRWQEWAVV